MDTLQNKISPKDAGALGVKFFQDVMPSGSFDRVLLEGLELDDVNNRWEVTVGFDSVRALPKPEKVIPSIFAISAISRFVDEMSEKVVEQEIVREFRTVYLKASDGSFVKMDNH